jgi:putative flavoprotein involved in K+ transport
MAVRTHDRIGDIQMTSKQSTEHVETIVIGGGQAGLSVGYQLSRRNRPFVILDASDRIGDAWRNRWDSLRLFSPARYDGLAGMPFPSTSPHYFPTKDEMADYLESYAKKFNLPVRSGTRVDRVTRINGGFSVQAGEQLFEADNVVVAMANYQKPKVPEFAKDLAPDAIQLHSSEYRNPDQLREGGVLIVGAGNSGAEIAIELVRNHRTLLSGRDVGQVPFDINGFLGRLFLVQLTLRGLFHRVLTVSTPMGRKARPKIISHGGPLIRTKRKHLAQAGVEFVPRMAGVENGKPVLDDGRALDVSNVIWCTGYHYGFSWIDLPVHGEHEPQHERGIVPSQPGLYFVGLEFLYSLSSIMVHGLERDAERITGVIEDRATRRHHSDAAEPARQVAAD